MKFFALICARGGSKGIKNKNLINFKGMPLIAHSILIAKKLKKCSYVVVSTDSKKIGKVASNFGADIIIDRPSNLANDNSPEVLTWKHAITFLNKHHNFKSDFLISVPTTSPLRDYSDLRNSIIKFKKEKCDGLITITKSKKNPFFNMVKKEKNKFLKPIFNSSKIVTRRQSAPKIFDITTVAYVYKSSFILNNNNNILDGRISYLEIPQNRAIDIDDMFDLEIAKYFANK
mgnify:CR=1 FL=1